MSSRVWIASIALVAACDPGLPLDDQHQPIVTYGRVVTERIATTVIAMSPKPATAVHPSGSGSGRGR